MSVFLSRRRKFPVTLREVEAEVQSNLLWYSRATVMVNCFHTKHMYDMKDTNRGLSRALNSLTLSVQGYSQHILLITFLMSGT